MISQYFTRKYRSIGCYGGHWMNFPRRQNSGFISDIDIAKPGPLCCMVSVEESLSLDRYNWMHSQSELSGSERIRYLDANWRRRLVGFLQELDQRIDLVRLIRGGYTTRRESERAMRPRREFQKGPKVESKYQTARLGLLVIA